MKIVQDCCNKCNNPCNSCGGCAPAQYGCDFDIQADPYNPDVWIFTMCGMSHRVTLPDRGCIDLSLVTNYEKATMSLVGPDLCNSPSVLSGAQLGEIINLDDLRNVEIDNTLDGNCYELIYHKDVQCGTGCESPEDAWSNWNINSEDALQPAIRYVRGASADGCPVYLNVPEDEDEYWFGGWVPGEGFTYYQATEGTLPTNEDGDPIIASYDPTTKKPIYGALDLPDFDCILTNLVQNFGTSVKGDFQIVQGTPGFESTFNPVNGNFTIEWDDWGDTDHTVHVGSGKITGKLTWTSSFNVSDGTITYNVTNIHFGKATYNTDAGISGAADIILTLAGVSLPSNTKTTVLNAYHYTGNSDWSETLDADITTNFSVTLDPGTTSASFRYAYLFVNWSLEDDEGYDRVKFYNKLSGWDACE